MKTFKIGLNILGFIVSCMILKNYVSFSFQYSMYLEEQDLLPTDVLDGVILADVSLQKIGIILVALISVIFLINILTNSIDLIKTRKR